MFLRCLSDCSAQDTSLWSNVIRSTIVIQVTLETRNQKTNKNNLDCEIPLAVFSYRRLMNKKSISLGKLLTLFASA